jgi:predicted amidohydrolase YtcJ
MNDFLEKNFKIPRCYDSHTHILGTGIFLEGLNLFSLQSLADLKTLKIKSDYFKCSWLVGFGWDHTKWNIQDWPTHHDLDEVFPDFPVALSRADGHTVWLNSRALQEIGYYKKTETEKPTPSGGVIIRDQLGHPTGIFQEHAKLLVDFTIPDYSLAQKKNLLLASIRYFLSQGFSHIRDMTGNIEQWELLREILTEQSFPIFIEQNFVCENRQDFIRAMREFKVAQDKPHPQLRALGIKVFYDGSLGSEGAYLSQNYRTSTQKGILLWEDEDLDFVISETWKAQAGLAIHTIGDEAAHRAILSARRIWDSGLKGRINIEHAQILRAETIALMKSLDVVCHMQPCHFLSDRRWLKDKLGDLYSRVFPWRDLDEAGIKMQFGSDSPIEKASVTDNLKALQMAESEGIPALNKDPLLFHSHPDESWGSACVSIFVRGQFSHFSKGSS